MIMEAGDATVQSMAEAALDDIVRVKLWSKEDDSFEADCDSLYNMAVTNRLQEKPERRQTGCFKALYNEQELCTKLPDCLFNHDKEALDVAFVQMIRRLLQVRAYKRCVEKGLIKEIVISPDFLKANPEPSRPPRPTARPGQQPPRVEERQTIFSTPPNRVLARPGQPQRGRELRYIAKGEEEENMEKEFTQAEEDMFELQYLASKEVERQEKVQGERVQEEDLQQAFRMQDAPEVVVGRLRTVSAGPVFQIQLRRQDGEVMVQPVTVTCLLDSGATVSYIQKKLVDSFRGSLHPDDLVTSRNVIKFGSGNPQLATELVILGIKGSYYGLEVDEIIPFIILDTTEFQVIVGWRDIARRDALFVLLHQMKMDAEVEIASEGEKESLSYMKAHLAHLEPVQHRVPEKRRKCLFPRKIDLKLKRRKRKK